MDQMFTTKSEYRESADSMQEEGTLKKVYGKLREGSAWILIKFRKVKSDSKRYQERYFLLI